jgi:hypothetical protein
MDNENLKTKKITKDNSILVKISPIETDKEYKDKFGEKKQMSRHWQLDKAGRFFAANLTAQQLKPALAKARVKLENLLLKDEGDFIVYMYKSRPLIKLNVKEGQFYAPISTMAEFDKEDVQQQAHIVLEILKNNGLSNALRGKENLQSNARQLLSKLKTYKE